MKLLASCNHCVNESCNGRGITYTDDCPGNVDPTGTFMLAELALEHPQSLNNALSNLPFKVNLDFVLK